MTARRLQTSSVHRELILNWFRAKGAISAGIVEGLNNKVKLTTRRSYGSAPTMLLKPLCITTSEPYPNLDLPIDSGEEAYNIYFMIQKAEHDSYDVGG